MLHLSPLFSTSSIFFPIFNSFWIFLYLFFNFNFSFLNFLPLSFNQRHIVSLIIVSFICGQIQVSWIWLIGDSFIYPLIKLHQWDDHCVGKFGEKIKEHNFRLWIFQDKDVLIQPWLHEVLISMGVLIDIDAKCVWDYVMVEELSTNMEVAR